MIAEFMGMIRTKEFQHNVAKLLLIGGIALSIGIMISFIQIPNKPEEYLYNQTKEFYGTGDEIVNATTGIEIPEYTPFTIPSTVYILVNNAINVILIIIAAIYIEKWFPYLVAVVQGVPIGIIVGTGIHHIGVVIAAATLIPHGVIEILALAGAGATGIYLGTHKSEITDMRRRILVSIALFISFVALAAFIEVFITPIVVYWVVGI